MGWDCRVFEVNRRWMFRFPRREENRRWMERALGYGPLLERVVPLPIPRPTTVARSSSGRLLFVGYPKLPGRPLPTRGLRGPRAARWTRDLVRMFEALEEVTPAQARKANFPAPTVDQRRRIWRRRFRRVLKFVRPWLTPAQYREDRALYQESLADPSFVPRRTVLCHYDLFPHHILVGPGTRGITGVLDWEDACWADPATNVAALPTADGFARGVLDAWRPGEEELWRRSRILAHWVWGTTVQDRVQHGDRPSVPAVVRRYLATSP